MLELLCARDLVQFVYEGQGRAAEGEAMTEVAAGRMGKPKGEFRDLLGRRRESAARRPPHLTPLAVCAAGAGGSRGTPLMRFNPHTAIARLSPTALPVRMTFSTISASAMNATPW